MTVKTAASTQKCIIMRLKRILLWSNQTAWGLSLQRLCIQDFFLTSLCTCLEKKGPKPFYLTATESDRVSVIMHFRARHHGHMITVTATVDFFSTPPLGYTTLLWKIRTECVHDRDRRSWNVTNLWLQAIIEGHISILVARSRSRSRGIYFSNVF